MSNDVVRLCIGIPSMNTWDADFGLDLAFMTAYLSSPLPDGKYVHLSIQSKRGSMLANMREQMIQKALDEHYHYFLFIDTDQTFPHDLFHRLYMRQKQVVACNVATKSIPAWPTARLKGDTMAGNPVFTGPDDDELLQVWRIGTGIMLINLNVFKREGMDHPWFAPKWNPELQDFSGEDWGFCEKLENCGVKIYCDQDLSREIGHVGKFEYKHKHVVKGKDILKDAV